MKRRFLAVALLAALLALSACAAKEKALPVEGQAPAPPAPEVAPAWQEEWERVLAAAKREGRVAVGGPQGREIRQALTEPFEKKYGIAVEFLGDLAPPFWARVRIERESGQYLWDIYVGGVTTALEVMKPLGTLDPIEPALILPEVKDPKNWRDNKLFFADNDRTMLAMSVYSSGPWYVSPSLVNPREFKSWKDLLDPKWKGKIIMHDPRLSGVGSSRFQMFYLHPELGLDFMKALAPQLVLSRNTTQAIEWIAAGRYAINIAASETQVDDYITKGVPIVRIDPSQLKEGGTLAVGNGAVAIFNRAAHPNAAKVYLNWLLSKEGQTHHSKGHGAPSWRADVPWEGDPTRLPNPRYVNQIGDEARKTRLEVMRIAEEIFGR